VIDARRGLALRGVPEPEHLIPEQKERVVHGLSDDLEAELLDEESFRLRSILHAQFDVVEPD